MSLLRTIISALAAATVTVGVGAGMDYSSFTQAVYDTLHTGQTIVVSPGWYDIRNEYEVLFGDDVPESFRNGILIHDRKVIFMPGAKLTCTWDRSDNFSVIYNGGNVVLEGLDLYAEGMLYAIHDDQWHKLEPYVNEYRHCKIIGHLLKNANCIGGGMALNGRIIIDSCFFDNGVADSLTVRYHNTDMQHADGQIWISNSYFNGHLALTYYGTTAHVDVFVNGCRAEAIETRRELPDSDIPNIDLYSWNNEVKITPRPSSGGL